jgi:hypothetical protein
VRTQAARIGNCQPSNVFKGQALRSKNPVKVCLGGLDTQYGRGENRTRRFGRGEFVSLKIMQAVHRRSAASLRQKSNLLKCCPLSASMRRGNNPVMRMSGVLPSVVVSRRVARHVPVAAASLRMPHRLRRGRCRTINLARKYPRARRGERDHNQHYHATCERAVHLHHPLPIGFLILRPSCAKKKLPVCPPRAPRLQCLWVACRARDGAWAV